MAGIRWSCACRQHPFDREAGRTTGPRSTNLDMFLGLVGQYVELLLPKGSSATKRYASGRATLNRWSPWSTP